MRSRARTGEALVLLVATGAAQKWVPMNRWHPLLGRAGAVPATWLGQQMHRLPQRTASPVEHGVATAIRRAGRFLPWGPTCLAQASAGQIMLRQRHEPGVVVIGLRPGADGRKWDAHAWLLGRRGALTGGPAAAGFTATTVFEVPGGLRAREVDLEGATPAFSQVQPGAQE